MLDIIESVYVYEQSCAFSLKMVCFLFKVKEQKMTRLILSLQVFLSVKIHCVLVLMQHM